ncbi:uncharacterized protein isoform X2 [Rhodnius prolixus]|uniref:uncharacterized protein isoform X2 n=1 Tax=Rhodnius prolixus TaxID=13249 RepID=UPI003D18C06D
MSCYLMQFEGQPLMWQGQSSSKELHAILRQALLCPEKEKDDVVYSLEDKGPVRGGDPLLGASGEQPGHSVERTCRKRRLSESSMFDIPATAHGPKVKSTTSTEKMLFESPADLMQDDINPEMESPSQLPADNNEYTSHFLAQLSSSSLLPTMTSSQVSSVLSALEPNTATQLPACTANPPIKGLDNGNSSSAAESHMQTDHIKQTNSASLTILDLQPAEAIYLDKAKKKRTFCLTGKAIIRYYTENRVKGNVWYQCSSCPFISVRKSSIAQHCIISHDGNNKIGISSNVQMYKCLACDNIFSSTHSLKVHYLYDHNSTNEEIEEILKLSIETNKHLKGINSSFAPIKPDVSAVSEKNIEITVPTSNYGDTVQQVHEDQHPVEVINHSTAQFFPFFFTGEPQTANPSLSIPSTTTLPLPERCSAAQVSNADLPQTSVVMTVPVSPSIVTTSSVSTTLHISSQPEEIQSSNKAMQSNISQKLKDPALKKFRDLKLEKVGGKKCGLGGCALRFSVLSNLEYHKKCHYRTKWRCPECHISCTSWNTVSSHLWREHGIDIELYSCDHCNYKTNSLTRLLNLHRRIHSEERPFLCDVCGKGFKTTKQLRNHKSWHKLKEKNKTEIAEKLVKCISCGRGFTCARLMRLHVQVVHKRLKPYSCYVCGHSAANKSSLRSHLSMHTGLRPYSCDECDYSTRDHNNLRRHKMRHSGIKRYKCPLCSYSSIQATTYKTHILKKHPGQQDGLLYKCEICPFNTVKKENLLTHSARHEENFE